MWCYLTRDDLEWWLQIPDLENDLSNPDVQDQINTLQLQNDGGGWTTVKLCSQEEYDALTRA